jgi:hypothetical protein
MAHISMKSAILGPCVAIAVALALTACSAGDAAHRSFRPEVVTASGVPYTGNGIAALDPQAILTKAIRATSSAPTVRLAGKLTGVPVPTEPASASAGASAAPVRQSPGTFSLDMVFTQFGAVGDIVDGSVSTQLLRVQDEVWAAEPVSFWKAAGAVDGGMAYGGLYVKIPVADPGYSGFIDDTRIGFLLDRLLQSSAIWKKGPIGTVNGVSALELDGTSGGGHRTAVWVATDGAPYLLRTTPTAGSFHGAIDFTGYDQRLTVQAPVPGQVLDNALLVLPSLAPSTIAITNLPLLITTVPTTASASSSASASASASASRLPSRSASPSASPSSAPTPSNSASASSSQSPQS